MLIVTEFLSAHTTMSPWSSTKAHKVLTVFLLSQIDVTYKKNVILVLPEFILLQEPLNNLRCLTKFFLKRRQQFFPIHVSLQLPTDGAFRVFWLLWLKIKNGKIFFSEIERDELNIE